MRRSMLYAAVASLFVVALNACTADNTPTGPAPGSASHDKTPPPGKTPPPPPIGPPPVFGPEDFSDITAGANHTCARKYNNNVYCWGIDDNGQAGSWTTRTCVSGNVCVNRPTLLTMPGGSTPVAAWTIDAGSNHTCITDPSNDAYCWGDGGNGQVGFASGSYGPQFGATKVAGGLKFSLIGAGTQSTCGSGPSGVYCWGLIAGRAASPTIVSGYNRSVNLAVGDLHACIMDGSGNGGVQCWGNNRYGQLSLDPVAFPAPLFAIPATFSGPSARVATEASFTCTDETSGIVQCVGENTWGQLGNGQSGTSTSTDKPQTVGGNQLLHGVSTGSVHACALDARGYAFCWGNGFNGQLGNNAFAPSNTPQAVTGGHTYRAIAAGGQHTCAIGTDNHIYCWGQNGNGQLGTGGGAGSSFPQPAINP